MICFLNFEVKVGCHKLGCGKPRKGFDPNPTLRTGRVIDETDNFRLADLSGFGHFPLQGFEFVVQIADASAPCDRFIQD